MFYEPIAICGYAVFAAVVILVVFGAGAAQYLAAAFGITGALILATKIDPVWGFAGFLVSNIGWLAFSAARRHWGLFAQQVAFLVTSLIGLWNWWLGPLLLG